MQIPAGRLIDRFGERVMFGASVLVWSLFTAATAVSRASLRCSACASGWASAKPAPTPRAAKTVSHWFPLRLRGRATSVYDSGARIGSAAATPLIALIIGLFGLASGVLCRRRTRHAVGHRLVGLVPAAGVQGRGQRRRAGDHPRKPPGQSTRCNLHPDAEPMRIVDLFKQRTVWGMMLGFFCLNFMITFFLTWFPSYLVEERGFNLLKLGIFGSIPPIAAILGSWAGGLIGDYLLKRGWSLNKARKTCLVGGMLVCSLIALAAIAPQAWQALVLMSISYAASAFTIVTIWCLPADVVDSSTVATLGCTQNFFSNIGSALSPIIIGALYGATGTFEVPLLLTGVVVVAGALCFGFLIKKVEPIPRRDIQLATT